MLARDLNIDLITPNSDSSGCFSQLSDVTYVTNLVNPLTPGVH